MDYYLKCIKNYANFNGRATRKEYWMFALYNFIILFIFAILANYISGFFAIILGLYLIFTFLPNLAVNARRLHDINLSGWWQSIGLIPYAYIVLIILFCLKGNDNANRFGLNPLQEIE